MFLLTEKRGRKGQDTEYVEYSDPKIKEKFVVQKNQTALDQTPYWTVFYVEPGKKGRVKNLMGYRDKIRAESEAQIALHGYLIGRGLD